MPTSTPTIPETVTVSSADLMATIALVHAFEFVLAESVGRHADDFDQFLVGCGVGAIERAAFGTDVIGEDATDAVDDAIQGHLGDLLGKLRELTGGPADSMEIRLRKLAEHPWLRWDSDREEWVGTGGPDGR
jgi:hypothetical protein